MDKYDVAVIGAGPAGMAAAITASKAGKRVVLIERNPQLGRKLLATGNGRCNLTNRYVTVDRYHGANREFIETVLRQFDQNATLEFFAELGLVVKEEDNGRIFPRSNQASSVVEVLRQRLSENDVDVLLDALVVGIERSSEWMITLKDGRILQSDKLIIATGGKAAHHLGSTGDGWSWAKKLGHSLTEYHAALVPIETVEQWPADIQGIKVEARVWATSGGEKTTESAGDVLFTSYGVSGPAVMAQAGAIAPMLDTSKESEAFSRSNKPLAESRDSGACGAPCERRACCLEVLLHIDLFPDMTHEQLEEIVVRLFAGNGKKTVEDALVGLLHAGMIPVILRLARLAPGSQVAAVSKLKRLDIVGTLKDLTLTVSKLRPFKEAQVTAGGLNSDEIDPQTLQSRLVKGLYFAGEILDADGDSGGFNLQWAWSSGHVAGALAG